MSEEFVFISPPDLSEKSSASRFSAKEKLAEKKDEAGKDDYVFVGQSADDIKNIGDPYYAADQVGQSGFEGVGKFGEEKIPSWVAPAGAAIGAAAAYKGGVSPNVFMPGPGVFAPRAAPAPTVVPSMSVVDMEIGNVLGNIELFGQTPERMAYLDRLMQIKEGVTPRSEVEHIMQSGRGKGEPTGRQMEMAHNMETQRQALATKANLALPGAPQAVVEAGPMMVSEAGVAYPKRAAVEIEQEKKAAAEAERQREVMRQARERVETGKASIEEANRQTKLQAEQQREAIRRGRVTGAGKVGMGAAAGALGSLQAAQMATQRQPIDWTQWSSFLGNLGMLMRQTPGVALLGGLAQVPYAVKHREDITRGLTLPDISPTAGATGAEVFQPVGNLPGRP